MKSDLEVMNEMAKANMDIKSTTTVLGTKLVRGGAKLEIGYDAATHHEVASGVFGEPRYIVVTYFVNREEFKKLKNS